MKKLSKKIVETNLPKIEAYKLVNSNSTVGAKEVIGQPFKLNGYAICEVQIIEETGEVTEMNSLSLSTSIGNIGTSSESSIASLLDMVELFKEELDNFELVFTTAKAKSGNTFVDLEIA